MLFPTLGFLLFFLVIAAAMAVLDTRFMAKKAVLVGASYYFYAQWDWRVFFLLPPPPARPRLPPALFSRAVGGAPTGGAAISRPRFAGRSAEPIPIGPALLLILVGLFKKVVVANYLATGLVDPVFAAPTSYGGPDLLLATYGYAVQI